MTNSRCIKLSHNTVAFFTSKVAFSLFTYYVVNSFPLFFDVTAALSKPDKMKHVLFSPTSFDNIFQENISWPYFAFNFSHSKSCPTHHINQILALNSFNMLSLSSLNEICSNSFHSHFQINLSAEKRKRKDVFCTPIFPSTSANTNLFPKNPFKQPPPFFRHGSNRT